MTAAEARARLAGARVAHLATADAEPDFRATALAALRERYAPYRERPPEGPLVVVDVQRWSGWAASAGAGPRS